ncbi:MAG: hypothetical protein BGO69_10440 [Bacteroidetes bacterium 46-16]|nr:MAG: hypothetical protein BGO69_10440 [Bacteroidetes bacterium 46-16]
MTSSKYLKDIWENIFSIGKTVSICFLIFSGAYIFQNSLIHITKDVFTEHLFVDLHLGNLSDIISMLFFLCTVLFLILQFKNGRVPTPKSIVIYLTILSINYAIFRKAVDFDYYYLFGTPPIAYLDLLNCFLPLYFLRYRVHSEVKTDSTLPSFVEDRFDKKSKDLYSRTEVAKEIANLISNTVNKSAFAIAIIGKWGAGKTVFLRFLENNLKSQNEIVHFNPWKVTDVKQIYYSFFKSFSKALSKYDKNAAKDVKKYAEFLTEIDDENSFAKIVKAVFSAFEDEKDLSEKFDTINKSLNVIGKRFIVFVDDLDRLTGKEIIQTLKLIRNVADFSNVFFVVALDYQYTHGAMIKTQEVAFEEKYLQKIFQFEFVLAPVKKDFIVDQLRKMLSVDAMDGNEQAQFNIALNQLIFDKGDYVTTLFPDMTFEGDLESAIENMRDLIRFVNSFKTVYSKLKGEVDVYDLMMLELIKLKSVYTYQLIAERKIITGSKDHVQTHFVFDKDTFEKIFSEAEHTSNLDKSLVKSLVSNLFRSPSKIKPRSIIYPGSFEIYIYQELFQNISIKDWNVGRASSAIEFCNAIKQWETEGKGNSIDQLLSSMTTFANFEEFKKYVTVFLMMAETPAKRNWLMMAYSQFSRPSLLRQQYKISDGDIKDLVNLLLTNTNIPIYARSEFSSFFLQEVLQNKSETIGDKQFWYYHLTKLFIEFIRKTDTVDQLSYEIYWNLIEEIDPVTNQLKLTNRANKLMSIYLTKVKDKYGKYILRPYYNPPDEKFTFDPWLIQIFGSLENVITFINSINSQDELFKSAKKYLTEYSRINLEGKSYFTVTSTEKDRILILIRQLHAQQ